MKKYISLFLVLVLIITATVFSSGCDQRQNMTDSEIENYLNSEYNKLKKELDGNSDYNAASSYIVDWAEKNDFKISEKNNNYLVLSLKATKDYSSAETAVLQFPLDFKNFDKQCQTLASLLTTVKSVGLHGKINVIFTKTNGQNFTGAEALDQKYVDTDNFISLLYAGKPTLYNKGAVRSYTTMKGRYSTEAPAYTTALKLSISGLRGGSTNSMDNAEHPNPIMVIGKFLAAAKTKGVIFQLSSFNGGTSSDEFASSASAVLVAPDNDAERLTARFETSYENFADKCSENEPDFKYTLTPVKMPNTVLSDTATNNILNLLYTLDDGSERDSDGKITSAVNLGMLSTKNKTLQTEICARNTNKSNLQDLETTFQTVASLCDMKASTKPHHDPWITYSESTLVSTLSGLIKEDPTGMILETENTVFKDKKGDLDLVAFGTNAEGGIRSIKILINFLSGLNDVQESEK